MSEEKQSTGLRAFPYVIAGITILAVGIIGTTMLQPDQPVCAPDKPANGPNAPTPAADVFCFEAAAAGEEILIDFTLDEGAYLYRNKLYFMSGDPAVVLGTPRMPAGDMHSDEFFGEQEIYWQQFQVAVPYTRTAAVENIELTIELQGCDETIGLCYPPQNWTTVVSLPDGPIAAAPVTRTPGTATDLPGLLLGNANADEPLPIEQAFVPNPRFDAASELTLAWDIEPGYYLYKDKFTFAVNEGDIQFGNAQMPAGVPHEDLEFGEVEVYFDDIEIVVPFARAYPEQQNLVITAGYQGCKLDSICYPPAERVFELSLPASGEFDVDSLGPAPARVSEQDRFATLLTSGSWFAVLGSFYLGGLLLSFTPCVLPMVPILSGIIAGQGSDVSAGRGFALSGAYVLGMALTYTSAGVLAALAGSQVQAVFQEPWIIATFAALFVAMALGMFGLFEIQMPAAVQSRLSNLANRQKGGTFIGTAIIGALTALIVTTCVAPVLIGALAFIGQTGDIFRGGAALFIMAIGMGTPLLLVGASAGKVLPKVGPWMNTVKAGFGVMMIGLAIYMLGRILPGPVTLLLWALLVFLTGVFLGAFEALPESPRPGRRLAKGLGVLACLYGAILLIGSTLGGESPLRPIPRGVAALAGAPAGPVFAEVRTVAELDAMLQQARTDGQPVMVDFTADWCSDCRKMEAYTFPDPEVAATLAPFALLKIDISENNADDKALLERFETLGPPWMVFFDRYGRELGSGWTLTGYKNADVFAAHARDVAAL